MNAGLREASVRWVRRSPSNVPESTPSLRQYLAFLKRQAWLILLVPALTLAATAYVTSQQPTVYRATMGIFVAQAGGLTQPQIGSQSLTQTMTNILESDVIARRAIDRIGLKSTPDDLHKKLHVTVNPDSSVLKVTYDSENKRLATNVLGAVATEWRALIRDKLGVTGDPKRPGPFLIVADVLDPPHIEPNPVSPKPAKNMVFAGALGLALGLLFAFAHDSLDDRVRDRRDAEEWFGAPVIGALPRQLTGRRPALDGHRRAQAAATEALQLLRANLEFSQQGFVGKTILVTSGVAEEGKTSVAANLAATLALAGSNVICVDADLRRPALHQYLQGGDPAAGGLADVLEDHTQIEDVLEDVPVPMVWHGQGNGSAAASDHEGARTSGRLQMLRAGRIGGQTVPTVTADQMVGLVGDLSERADYVILNASPLLQSGDAFPLALAVDMVLVVARQGRTTRQRARAVRTTLEGLGAQRVAVVLTDSRARLAAASA
jgi:capsular polysaccharide biosynthesis protein/Mrp family chromosome partitioning ATPase